MFARSVLGALAVLAFAGASLRGADDFKPEALLPESTVFAVLAPDLATARGQLAQTKLGQMFAQPEMQAFCAPACAEMRAMYEEFAAKQPILPKLHDIDAGLLSGGLLVGLYTRDDPRIPAGMLIALKPKDLEAFKRLLPPPMQEALLGGNPMPLGLEPDAPAVVFSAGQLILVVPQEDLPLVQQRATDPAARQAGTLAQSPAFVSVQQSLDSPQAWSYLAPARIMDFVFQQTPLGADRDARMVAQALKALGMDSWQALGTGLGFKNERVEIRGAMKLGAPGAGFCALWPAGTPVAAESLKIAEKNAPYVAVSHFDASKLIPLLRSVTLAVEPKLEQHFDAGLAMIQNLLGIDVQADLLANFDTEIVTAQTEVDTSAPISLVPGLVLAVKLKDPARVDAALQKAVGALAQITQGQLSQFSLKPVPYKDKTMHYISDGLVGAGPGAFIVLGDRLYYGTTVNALRRGLEQLECKESIVDQAGFQETIARLTGQPFDPAKLPAQFAFAADRGKGTGSLILSGLGLLGAGGALAALSEWPGLAEAPAGDAATNERAATAACRTYAEAQDIYRRTDYDGDGVLEYAQALRGANSLLEITPGAADLMLIEQKMAEADGKPGETGAFHGYRFKVLKGQAGEQVPGGPKPYLVGENMTLGYALFAYPAQYGKSGTRSYQINNTGTLYAKDLGEKTAELAAKWDAYNLDGEWKEADLPNEEHGLEMEPVNPLNPFSGMEREAAGRTALRLMRTVDLGLWPDEGFFRAWQLPSGALLQMNEQGWVWRSELPAPSPEYPGSISPALLTAGVAVIAAIAIPNLLRSRMAANESAAIAGCKMYAEAQDIYRRTDYDQDGVLEYAQTVTGKHSLYEIEAGQGDLTLVDYAFAQASTDAGPAAPKAGYYFKVLKGQGPQAPGGQRPYIVNGNMTIGYALVAWPATWDNSGRNTFLINNTGIVYQKDWGAQTDEICRAMTEYNPDKTWVVAE